MTQEFLSFFISFGQTFLKNIPISLALAGVFTILTWFWACNPGQAWWHKRDLVTDLCYWFFIPVITRYLRIGMLIVGAALLFRITTADGLIAFYDNGHGPLAALPLVRSDGHLPARRGYHPVLDAPYVSWPAHVAVSRGAPLFRRAGMDLGGALPSGQFVSRQRRRRRHHASARHLAERVCRARSLDHRNSAFVHANLNWTLGPFKYVFAGPVFHRWHHTAPDRGGEKNFAATFPFLDVLFGTFYMPAGELPDKYGIAERDYPESFPGQLVRSLHAVTAGAANTLPLSAFCDHR